MTISMMVPEAAMHKDRPTPRGVREIGATRQFSGIEPVALPLCVHDLSDGQLQSGLHLRDTSQAKRRCRIHLPLWAPRGHA
jgi:hypothetical protein